MMASEDSEGSDNDRSWLTERKKEFREVIDINRDGIVDEAELKVTSDIYFNIEVVALSF